MSDKFKFLEILRQMETQELWSELARRYRVQFGKLEKVIHDWRPSEYTNLELRHKEEVSHPNLKTIS